MPPPVPLDLVTSGRELTEPRLSPDGARLAFVQRWRGSAAVVQIELDDLPATERLLTTSPDPAPGRGLGGGCFTWSPDGGGIVYAAADGELWSVRDAAVERLTSHGRVCRAPATHRPTPGHPGGFVVYVVDECEVWLTSPTAQSSDGEATHRRLDDGRHEFCFDPAVSPDGHTVSWQAWNPPDMPWDAAERVDCVLDTGTISTWRPRDGAVQQPRFAPDGAPTCVHDGTGWLNVHVGDHRLDEQLEHAGPSWGMGQRSYEVLRSGAIAVTRNESGFGSLCLSSPDSRHVEHVGRGVHGHLTAAGHRLAAVRSGARTTPQLVVYDHVEHPTRTRRIVAHAAAAGWDAVELPEPELVALGHDGVTLHARRYAAGRGRLLCWVHGGPTDQWQVDFRPRIAYWWSRGWDVLVVDPRGTTGHGRAYQQALRGGWGRLDVDDTAALVRHAHGAGWASPSTTVVTGGSSGGLTVLALLADHPHLATGGVVSYPVSDVAALADATHRFEAHYTDTLVGPPDDVARLREHSPVHRAGHIAVPLLVFHGADDPVVPLAQSETLAAAIDDAGGQVELVVYEGEGHGFRDPAHVRDEYERTERFLERVVGGTS